VLSAVVLGGVAVGFVPTETVPPVGWGFLVVAAFLCSAVAQVIQNRRYRLDQFEQPP
jgi:drug/metabolite transporter (DMT)-like permease